MQLHLFLFISFCPMLIIFTLGPQNFAMSANIPSANDTEVLIVDSNRVMLLDLCRNITTNNDDYCGGDIILDGIRHFKSSRDLKKCHKNSRECAWRVMLPRNKDRIKLQFHAFDITSNCDNNYIEVRNGLNSKSTLIGRFCGSKVPPTIYSKGRRLFVKLVSDGLKQQTGFTATVEKVSNGCNKSHGCQYDCRETHYGQECFCKPGYELQSDGKKCEPLTDYSGVIDSSTCKRSPCYWSIKARSGYKIVLNFTEFFLLGESGYPMCEFDNYIRIRNVMNRASFVHGPYCGNDIPPVITSMKDQLDISYEFEDRFEDSRFIAYYQMVPDNDSDKPEADRVTRLKTVARPMHLKINRSN